MAEFIEEEALDLTPQVQETVTAQAAANLSWKDALGELIDNSLDASATTISIAVDGRRSFVIKDNGRGQANMAAFLRGGFHARHSSTASGMFGVGAKDAMTWIGGEGGGSVGIESVSEGQHRSVFMRWANLRSWNEGPRPVRRESEPGEVGTQITVQPCSKTVPHGAQWSELVKRIGYIYSLAIEGGAQITLSSGTTKGKPTPAPAWKMPRLDPGHVETTIEVGGRIAKVRAGVIAEGESGEFCGITYRRGFRVLLEASGKGCGDYSPARVCGVVDLGREWTPSRNKNGLVSGEKDLFAAVEAAILPVLRRAEQVSSTLGCQAFQGQIEASINALVARHADAKAKRSKGEKSGTNKPTGTGAPHRQAEVEQSGSTFRGKRRSGAYRVEHQRLGGDTLGVVREYTVILNLDNAFVAQVQKSQNLEAGVALAATLVGDVERSERPNGQRVMATFEGQTLPGAVGKILSSHPSLDGRPVLAAVAG